MTLLYRAIWQDSLPDVTAQSAAAFRSWVTDKWGSALANLDPNDERTVDLVDERNQAAVHVEVRTATLPAQPAERIGSVHRADLIETHESAGTRWHTTLRAWEAPDEDGHWACWTWIDVEVVGEVRPDTIAPAAPRLAADLLAQAHTPRVGTIGLPTNTDNALSVGDRHAANIASTITDPTRVLPVIVLEATAESAAIPTRTGGTLADVVDALWRGTAGLCALYVIDDHTARTMTDILGTDLGLWGGVMRIYLPGLRPDGSDAARHRYFFANHYATSPHKARLIATSRLALPSAMRRPPVSYAAIKARLDEAAVGGRNLLAEADAELGDAEEAARELQTQLAERNDALEELALEYAVALEEVSRLQQESDEQRQHIQVLQAKLTVPDTFSLAPALSLPHSCASPSEALDLARTHLGDRIIIPETAARDLDDLDATVTCTAWGQTAWAAFQALHAYATARSDGWNGGGFWEWCKTSGHRKAWPATKKKLAMCESGAVMDREKFRRHRQFDVPAEYSTTGTLYMEAHMKISEGGGNLAPRIYFDADPRLVADPKTQTNKVLIGYYGPHKHLPNTKT